VERLRGWTINQTGPVPEVASRSVVQCEEPNLGHPELWDAELWFTQFISCEKIYETPYQERHVGRTVVLR